MTGTGGAVGQGDADVAQSVAAHAGVAAGAKQLRCGQGAILVDDHRAAFCAHRDAAAHQRRDAQPATDRTHKGLAVRPHRGAGADVKAESVAAGRKGQAVEVAAGPAVVQTQRRTVADACVVQRAGDAAGAHCCTVVLQVSGAVYAFADLHLPEAQGLRVGDQFVVVHSSDACQPDPAPVVGVRQGGPLGLGQWQFAVKLQLGDGPPVQAGYAVVGVLNRRTRSGVGGQADAEHHFLQHGFAHLHRDGRGIRVAVRVNQDIG